VKEYFNIPIQIDSLEVSTESKHRSEYLVGGEFNMSGLLVTVIYDDFSMETVDATVLTLVNTGKLTKYDRFVTVEYEGYSVAVEITVTDPSEKAPTTSDSSVVSSSEEGGSYVKNIALIIMGVILLSVGGIGVWMLYKRRPVRVYDEEEYEEYEEIVEYEEVEESDED
jgi:hypothetical protein